jgi:hypothetical protein
LDHARSLLALTLLLFFFLAELALLDADKDVLVGISGHLRISYDEFRVLPRTHSEVLELTVLLIQLLECALGLHDEVAHECADLHGWQRFWEELHGYSVEVYQYVPSRSRLRHKIIQCILHFASLSSRLHD